MFDDLIREVKRLEREGMAVSVPVPADANGYLDRECPADRCLAWFKVYEVDWRALVSDEVAYCVVCRHQAPADNWFTTAHLEAARDAALAEAHNRISAAFARGVRSANVRRPRGGFLDVAFSYSPGPRVVAAPLEAHEVLTQRSTCEPCGCRYASVGAAFFCPACGCNAAIANFAASLETVRKSLDLLPTLADSMGRDAGANLGRDIVENGLVKAVSALEAVAEAVYERLPEPKPSITGLGNVFQRLDDASRLFRETTGAGYEAHLSARGLDDLRILVQQRHLLQHQGGIVDQKYVDRSGDRSYTLGQRLVIREAATKRAVELVEKLGQALAATDGVG